MLVTEGVVPEPDFSPLRSAGPVTFFLEVVRWRDPRRNRADFPNAVVLEKGVVVGLKNIAVENFFHMVGIFENIGGVADGESRYPFGHLAVGADRHMDGTLGKAVYDVSFLPELIRGVIDDGYRSAGGRAHRVVVGGHCLCKHMINRMNNA